MFFYLLHETSIQNDLAQGSEYTSQGETPSRTDFPLPSSQSIYNLSVHLLIRQSTCAPAVLGEKVCGRMKVSLLSIIKFLRRFSMMTNGSGRCKLSGREKKECSQARTTADYSHTREIETSKLILITIEHHRNKNICAAFSVLLFSSNLSIDKFKSLLIFC